jgi:hypothetical protein
MLDPSQTVGGPEELGAYLSALGELLESRGYRYHVVLIGGASLLLQGLIARPTTRDVDILAEWTSEGLRALAALPRPFAGGCR